MSEAIGAKVRDVAEHEDIELTSETLDFIEMHPGTGDATYAPFVVIDRLDQPVKIEGALRRQPPMPIPERWAEIKPFDLAVAAAL